MNWSSDDSDVYYIFTIIFTFKYFKIFIIASVYGVLFFSTLVSILEKLHKFRYWNRGHYISGFCNFLWFQWEKPFQKLVEEQYTASSKIMKIIKFLLIFVSFDSINWISSLNTIPNLVIYYKWINSKKNPLV